MDAPTQKCKMFYKAKAEFVGYIVYNGVMKDLSVLQEPPFIDQGNIVRSLLACLCGRESRESLAGSTPTQRRKICVEGNCHEGFPHLVLCRQRGCVSFREKRKGHSKSLTMEEIGKIYGVSKMAVSKRLKKLHEKLRSSVT